MLNQTGYHLSIRWVRSSLTIISLEVFIQNTTRSLVGTIRNPNCSDFAIKRFVEVVPQRLISFLWILLSSIFAKFQPLEDAKAPHTFTKPFA